MELEKKDSTDDKPKDDNFACLAVGAGARATGFCCIAIGDMTVAKGEYDIVVSDNISIEYNISYEKIMRIMDILIMQRLVFQTLFPVERRKEADRAIMIAINKYKDVALEAHRRITKEEK